jgi:hypothetical protein
MLGKSFFRMRIKLAGARVPLNAKAAVSPSHRRKCHI